MPTLPQQPALLTSKSLQINIDSEDDAKAVIQHLPRIKATWDLMNNSGLVDSVEFAIAEPVRKKVEATLTGAIRWCRTYVKQVQPFEGNVFFALPHCVPVAPVPPVQPAPKKSADALPAAPATELVLQAQEAHGKSKRPVRAELAAT